MKPYLWCPRCKTYPTKIREVDTGYTETRVWDGDECYELIGGVEHSENIIAKCSRCNTVLVERVQSDEDTDN